MYSKENLKKIKYTWHIEFIKKGVIMYLIVFATETQTHRYHYVLKDRHECVLQKMVAILVLTKLEFLAM